MFTAQYAGRCAACDDPIRPGDLCAYSDDLAGYVGDACCGGVSDTVTPERVTPARVMPRGRTVADACPECFQIPSNNGTCGCVG